MKEVMDAAVHTLSPTFGVNKDVVDQVFKLLGERNQVAYVVDQTGEAFEKMFNSMPRPDQVTFIDRMKLGEAQPTPELQEAASFIRRVDTQSWEALTDAAEKAGMKNSPVKWLENHYRVMWREDSTETGWFPDRVRSRSSPVARCSRHGETAHSRHDERRYLGRRRSLLHNPITNLKQSLADIWKYTTALKMWGWAKDHGFASFVRGPFPKLPEGMTWLDDSIADVWFPAESGEGLVHAGKYALEEGFGRILNNYLSRDLIRQTKTGRGLMWIKIFTTSLELMLSLFRRVRDR
jgi:hypothetical protein